MNNRKELEVVAALIEREGKILLCQRKEEDAFALLWEFPGGKVENSETNQQALQREIKEELNIDIVVGPLVAIFEDLIPTLKINVHLYKIMGFKGKIESLDCRGFAFYELTQTKDLDLAPVDRKIVDYLLRQEE